MADPSPHRTLDRTLDAIDVRRIEILDKTMVEVLRAKTEEERVTMVFDAERTMRLMLEAQLHDQHRDWDNEQVAKEIARRRNLGTD